MVPNHHLVGGILTRDDDIPNCFWKNKSHVPVTNNQRNAKNPPVSVAFLIARKMVKSLVESQLYSSTYMTTFGTKARSKLS
jgi:hypothetical protein